MQNKINIIYENDDFMVIVKPAGLTVNRSDTAKDEQTLQDLVEDLGKIKPDASHLEFTNRGGIVHRLDKETSGVMIVAKNSESFDALQAQFKERRVEKEYIALAHGEINPEKGEINVPVGRLPWNRKRFGALAGGREAQTEYEVIKEYILGKEILSLVKLHPRTGRTHQIRVHLKFINHPIFGDPLYGGRKTSRDDRKILPRVFLHAKKISFFDPRNGEKIEFEAELTPELLETLDKLMIKKDN
ncbi:RluA family pseudouridine synthase [Candidatus Dojkabacteria bacterium]|uniref:Pseudouridine synthase n=1 Tax=Candidatus Dojkabacteria bacterium TaxID=2099670 RepID=A0A5C7J334_9BACT|nr:MAG: RluA family pseudouridine synthase [Candidatus Dojkabacteria bacterium]